MQLIVWFEHIPETPSSLHVIKLRGGRVFDVLSRDKQLIPGTGYLSVQQAHARSVPIPPDNTAQPTDILFADLPLLTCNPRLADIAFGLGCPVIVDLHFPLDEPDEILAVQDVPPSERDLALDDAAREFWRDPELQTRAHEILRMADAITASPAGRASGYKLHQLPDITTRENAAMFYRRFAGLATSLMPGSSLWRALRKTALTLPIWLYSRDVAEQVQLPEPYTVDN